LRDLAQLQPASNPGRYAVAPIPVGYTGERVPYIGPGGYIAGVMKDSAHAAAGWDLLNYLSSAEVSLGIAIDPRVINAPVRLRIPREEEYRQALLEGIRSALTNKTDPKGAMDNINRRWQELDTKVPKEQRLIDYLRSLNLKP
jgi:ABC-type glycerol-3-phosphate transport system substrate-binding protein